MAVVASPYPVFHSLNLLRGLAALAVVLFHASPIFGRQMAPSGYLAVDLFFIMSGFVIAHVYDPRFAAGLTAHSFILARMARFWPLFALGTVLGAGWILLENLIAPPAAFSISETLVIGALGLLYIPRIAGGDLFPLNVPAWSLFFELIVNAAFAMFFAASKTRWLAAVIVVAGAVIAGLAMADRFDAQSWGWGRACFGFALGVFLYRTGWTVPTLTPWMPLALVCATFALPSHPAVELACVGIIYPASILLLRQAPPTSASPMFDRIGVLSFPLYALHYPILQAFLGAREHVPAPAWVIGMAAITACVAAAWLGEHVVDRPMRQLIRSRSNRVGQAHA
jgi:peptidoglycan/LPS O-acetylase OafA/YrhL